MLKHIAFVKSRTRWLEVCIWLTLGSLVVQLLPELVRYWNSRRQPGQEASAVATITGTYGDRYAVQYLIYLPREYFQQRTWPLLLFLHGSGQCGDDSELVKKHGPPAMLARGDQLPMIVVSPQCRAGECWNTHDLLALLDQLQDELHIDRYRIYVAGYSMGGTGVWNLISAEPSRFAAAVSVCGDCSEIQPQRLVTLPIWAFHGAKDTVIPLEPSKRTIDAIQANGGKALLTVYEDQGHQICELAFSRDVYDWLLRQRRSDN